MTSPIIIMLNGPSSSGKSTIAESIQKTAKVTFANIGCDFIFSAFDASNKERFIASHQRSSEEIVRGYYHVIRSFAEYGNSNVVADTVFQYNSCFHDCVNTFKDSNAYLIGVHCSLEELKKREAERKDRLIGIAQFQHERVHLHELYDHEVDTTHCSAEECAKSILSYIDHNEPAAFRKLVGSGDIEARTYIRPWGAINQNGGKS